MSDAEACWIAGLAEAGGKAATVAALASDVASCVPACVGAVTTCLELRAALLAFAHSAAAAVLLLDAAAADPGSGEAAAAAATVPPALAAAIACAPTALAVGARVVRGPDWKCVVPPPPPRRSHRAHTADVHTHALVCARWAARACSWRQRGRVCVCSRVTE